MRMRQCGSLALAAVVLCARMAAAAAPISTTNIVKYIPSSTAASGKALCYYAGGGSAAVALTNKVQFDRIFDGNAYDPGNGAGGISQHPASDHGGSASAPCGTEPSDNTITLSLIPAYVVTELDVRAKTIGTNGAAGMYGDGVDIVLEASLDYGVTWQTAGSRLLTSADNGSTVAIMTAGIIPSKEWRIRVNKLGGGAAAGGADTLDWFQLRGTPSQVPTPRVMPYGVDTNTSPRWDSFVYTLWSGGQGDSAQGEADMLNALLTANPQARLVLQIWPIGWAGWKPRPWTNEPSYWASKMFDYRYWPGTASNVHRTIQYTMNWVYTHLKDPEYVTFSFGEEIQAHFGSREQFASCYVPTNDLTFMPPVDPDYPAWVPTNNNCGWLPPMLALYAPEIEAERGLAPGTLRWDLETYLWCGKAFAETVEDIHRYMKTCAGTNNVLFWPHPHGYTLDCVSLPFQQAALYPIYWTNIVKPGVCDGLVANSFNDWEEEFMTPVTNHNWMFMSQLWHQPWLRAGDWYSALEWVNQNPRQNFGYFLFCDGGCASTNLYEYGGTDPLILAPDESRDLHVRRLWALLHVGDGLSPVGCVLTSPHNGWAYDVADTVTLSVTADSTSGKVSKVEFYAYDRPHHQAKLGTVTNPPYALAWDASNTNMPLAAGSYLVSAIASDTAGITNYSGYAAISVGAASSLIGHWPADEGSGTAVADVSGNANTARFVGAPTWITGRTGAGLQLNGSDACLAVSNSASFGGITTALTVSCWAKNINATNSFYWNSIGNLVAKAGVFYFHPQNAGGNRELVLNVIGPNGYYYVRFILPAELDLTQWHLYTATYGDFTTSLYVDGIQIAPRFPGGTPPASLSQSGSDMLIGRMPNADFFSGAIDDVRLYNRVLSQAEIQNLAELTWPATVRLTAPAEGSVVNPGTPVALAATVRDPIGTVRAVSFYKGTEKVGADTTTPYGCSWTPTVAGQYALTAVASNNMGLTTTSGVVTIRVNASPTVQIVAPAANSFFAPAPVTIGLSANALDGDGPIARVEFYAGTTYLGTGTYTAPVTFARAWTNVIVGNYSLTARAYDKDGAATTSAPVNISVLASMDINATGGSVACTNGVFTMVGRGAGVTGTADGFRFVYLPVASNCTIMARVYSVSGIYTNAGRAGVMIRESTAAGAKEVSALLAEYYSPDREYQHYRKTTNGATTNSSYLSQSSPAWVKVVRNGTTFNVWCASDSSGAPGAWSKIGSDITGLSMSNTVLVGLAMTSGKTNAANTGTVDHLSITAP